MPDKDLWGQLEGLFSDAGPGPEPAAEETEEVFLEETVDDLLETEPVPAAAEPLAEEAPSPFWTGPEEAEGQHIEFPLSSGPAWDAAVVDDLLEVGAEPPIVEPVLAAAAPPVLGTLEEAEEEQPEIPPPSVRTWDALIREERVRILNILLGILTSISTVLAGALLVDLARQPSRLGAYALYFAAYVLLVTVTLARRLNFAFRAAVPVALLYGAGVSSAINRGALVPADLYLLVAPLVVSVLFSQQAGALAAGVSAIAYVALVIGHHFGWLQPAAAYDLTQWSTVLNLGGTFALVAGAATLIRWMSSSALGRALRETEERRAEAVQSRTLLEEQAGEMAVANDELQRRTLQLQTALQVAQIAGLVLDVGELLQQVANVVREQFGLSYAGLFLVDESGRWAVLRAGTGETGRQMLRQGHRLMVGGASMVGWCTANGQPRIAADLGKETMRYDNPLLGETRAEMAVPLRSAGRVIGALDVQSDEPEAFSEEDVPVFQALADQVVVAINKAERFAEVEARLEEMEESQRSHVRERWVELPSAWAAPLYERNQPGVVPLGDALPREVEQAMTRQEVIAQAGTGDGVGRAALVVPIRLRDEVIGALGLHETEGERRWSADEIALIEAVADEMALAIENARLLAETQRRAERERLIGEISARVRASMDPDVILRTTVREIGRALGAERTTVQVTGPASAGGRAPGDDAGHREEE